MTGQNRIVFSTDFSDASFAALDWAKKMSEDLNAELHCVTAVEELLVYTPMLAVPVSLPSVEELSRHAQSHLDELVSERISGFSKAVTTKVLHGRPADEIVRYADEIDATMIVMATHGRSGAAHLFIGSTAEGVLRQANCPVLSIRASNTSQRQTKSGLTTLAAQLT